MRIRTATLSDAPVLGRVMVESWLAAHRGQLPDAAWQKRVDEWTPDVSARGWARVLGDEAEAQHVLLVAEDGSGVVDALVFGTTADDDPSATTAEVSALYVRPDSQGRGVGAALLRAAARELAGLGFVTLRVGVLSATFPLGGSTR